MLASTTATENNIYTVIAILGGILAVAAVLGAAFAIFRQKLSESTVDILKENNAALEQKNKINEQTIAELKSRVDKLEAENITLKDRVDAKQELETIHRQTDRILDLLEGGGGGSARAGRPGNRTG